MSNLTLVLIDKISISLSTSREEALIIAFIALLIILIPFIIMRIYKMLKKKEIMDTR